MHVGYRSVSSRRLDILAVTTVTDTPSCSTRDGRSRRSQCDTRAGSVDTITSSNSSRSSASRTTTSGSVSPMRPSTCPPSCLLQQRDRELEGQRRLLRLRVPVGTRYEQYETASLVRRAAAHLVQEPWRARRAVRDDQDASRGGGLYVEPLARFQKCLKRAGPPRDAERLHAVEEGVPRVAWAAPTRSAAPSGR